MGTILPKLIFSVRIIILQIAVGCIFAELFTLKPICQGDKEANQLFEYFILLGKPSNSYFDKFTNIKKETITAFKQIKDIEGYNITEILNVKGLYKVKTILYNYIERGY